MAGALKQRPDHPVDTYAGVTAGFVLAAVLAALLGLVALIG